MVLLRQIFSGLLTGKNKRGSAPVEGTRVDIYTKINGPTIPCAANFNDFKDNEKYWKIDEHLHMLAQKYGTS